MKIDPAKLGRKEGHDLIVGVALPRPIAFVSTIDAKGVYNLAPFSFFIPVSVNPTVIGVVIGRKADGRKKDTLA
ncbi:MAG TPA: flavin reductase family protein, partial [Thermodesulfobacteriota bacterium]|nr:flavin reductase family protein [Thermodesulfobacteriota bacterium]